MPVEVDHVVGLAAVFSLAQYLSKLLEGGRTEHVKLERLAGGRR